MRKGIDVGLILLFCILCVPRETAAQLLNPTTVVFRASADHDAKLADGRDVVERYDLEIWSSTEATIPESQVSLGKPSPDSTGEIALQPPVLIAVPVGRSYQITVAAVGPSGISRSDARVPFERRGPPAPPTSVTLR